MDGFEMESGFAISVSSELMAILAIAKDLEGLFVKEFKDSGCLQ